MAIIQISGGSICLQLQTPILGGSNPDRRSGRIELPLHRLELIEVAMIERRGRSGICFDKFER